ncbi:YecA family protein [Grimontia hollisae]|uniref:YecA family protein n=2 Tax=Grimontia hollisae TaxID=673 RepID=D0IBF4_GRIHO|nr:UPF0149 family protein [Grimontia hollisae]AMG29609.1 YecA family protein [Grimontia hollisae]EEY71222.1 hypothetical protein VHA_003081 [Grimontia hollisae CIP 101886]MDF2186543.1 UPF0149 family protein [Grimontia hollisae]STO43817.1 Predicted metal-binding protein related to the C-terminal domain of SecA [Grimontia hollisae]STO57106.1 Predicted metal-binding protein related to the C-terminal domain of SecA [Grimontia hollisae]
MSISLSQFIAENGLEQKLLSAVQTEGFVTAMAAAPHLIDPSEWLAFMWGGEEEAPFASHEQLEQYANIIVNMWNTQRGALLSNEWKWPEACALSESDIVNQATREYCEGMLQGWTLCRDDWETLMPEDSQENALLGGVLLSISLLFDPESALAAMAEQGAGELAQFEEVFNGMPVMLCGLAIRAYQMAEQQ